MVARWIQISPSVNLTRPSIIIIVRTPPAGGWMWKSTSVVETDECWLFKTVCLQSCSSYWEILSVCSQYHHNQLSDPDDTIAQILFTSFGAVHQLGMNESTNQSIKPALLWYPVVPMHDVPNIYVFGYAQIVLGDWSSNPGSLASDRIAPSLQLVLGRQHEQSTIFEEGIFLYHYDVMMVSHRRDESIVYCISEKCTLMTICKSFTDDSWFFWFGQQDHRSSYEIVAGRVIFILFHLVKIECHVCFKVV